MRPTPSRLVVGAAAVVVAYLVVRAVVADDADRPRPTAAPAPPRVAAPDRAAAVRVVPDPAAEQLPGAHCWDGLLDVDRAGSMDDLRAVLARAAASGDDLLAGYVRDRLVELVGDDVARAAQLLDWADAATGVELEVLLAALARTEAVRAPTIADRLLRTGEDPAAGDHRRALAVGALDTQPRLGADAIARLSVIASTPDGGDPAWAATRTIGRVMKNDFERTGAYAPYWDELLAISRTTPDLGVRVLALELPAYVDPILDAGYIDDLATLLTTAPEREVREMAAFQLGLTEDPDRVVRVFRAAFPREPELCVRWAIVRFTVRAAGRDALPALEEMAATDGRFQPDLDDFRRIYASGIHDFERVWLDKAEHHPCSADDDHGGDA